MGALRVQRDKRFLANRAYPVMHEATEFFLDYLVDDGHGSLVTGPSVSPENKYKLPNGTAHSLSIGPTMDIEICRALFTHLIEASNLLHRDPAFRDKVSNALERLRPSKSESSGQLQEWSQDYAEVSLGHRHISHLRALYPGDQMDIYRTPSLAAAARISLERRLQNGSGQTGWSRAWIMNYWARLGDGNQAYASLQVLLRNSTFPNLFDNHRLMPSFFAKEKPRRQRAAYLKSMETSAGRQPSAKCFCKARVGR